MQRGTVLGFYQDVPTAHAVLKRLRANRIHRAILLNRQDDGRVVVESDLLGLLRPITIGGVIGVTVGLALLLLLHALFAMPKEMLAVTLFTGLLGGLIAWRAVGVPPVEINVFKLHLVRGESLVLVFTGGQDAARILDVMRQNAGDNPITFAFYPAANVIQVEDTDARPTDPLSPDRLSQMARDLAASHTHTIHSQGGRPLNRRLRASERAILRVREHLAAVARLESNVLLAAEWLLDNTYIIQGQIEDFRRSLPRRYEQQLPVLQTDEESRKQSDNAKDKARDTEIGETQAEGAIRSRATWQIYVQGAILDLRDLLAESSTYVALSERFAFLPSRSTLLTHRPLPRVYELARAVIDGTDARLDRDNLHNFLQAYQSVTPLTIGELWAVPLMLRLRLIEQLRSLAVIVDQRQREREIADFWANRILTSARRDRDQLHTFLAELVREVPFPTPHFAEQLIGHLYDEEDALAPVREWLERRLDMSLADMSASERTTQAREQLSLGNAISSLRQLGRLEYAVLFEAVSRIDAILYNDPPSVYSSMDFATRDRYRHAIEEIARRSCDPAVTEFSVAFKAVEMAEAYEDHDDVKSHIGYFLIDSGRRDLEAEMKSLPRPRVRLQRWTEKHGTALYLSTIFGLTAAIVSTLCIQAVWAGTPLLLLVPLALLGALPASDVAVQIVNYFVTRVLPPRVLPKMDFEQGVPQTFRTLVVVPMMLLTPESIQDEVDRLEIRYLANPDTNLRYALLSDFSDAPQPRMPEDAERLDVAIRGLEHLNAKYPSAHFLLFHRNRGWSESEGRWMGWERKRGKLEQLNTVLMGLKTSGGVEEWRSGIEKTTEGTEDESVSSTPPLSPSLFIPPMEVLAGDVESAGGIRFVITLDADTQLPRDTGRRLVETLAHPLNQPVLAEEESAGEEQSEIRNPKSRIGRSLVLRGYTILQPRVSTSLPSATASHFSRLFTDPRGVDPYTRAVSDVYQDLTNEGSYHGKGIYDLAAFHKTLSGRFPTSHLLSHDLIEGAHVRVGLVSDVELFDLFPRDYVVYSNRQHRWVRGDWQISDWLKSLVPGGNRNDNSPALNPLTLLNRWKIFDNLRRSLLPVACLLLLALAWMLAPGQSPRQWTWLVAWTFLCPPALQLMGRVTTRWRRDPLAWQEMGTSLVRAALFLSLLPHQAWLNLDAMVRVWFRKLVSRRLLLEWETASEAHRRSRNKRRQFARNLGLVSLGAIILGSALALQRPDALLIALPMLALWSASPVFVSLLNREVMRDTAGRLTSSERHMVREVARQTWRFFDDLVGPQTNWLPPDNYQIDLRVEVAPRTSPTNIGLGLLASLAAQDMGYITLDDTVDRTHNTLLTMEGLASYEGHLFNWYDTTSRQPLPPRYVSFVDSGNLLGDLWALGEGIRERLDAPLLDHNGLEGLADALHLLNQSYVPAPPDAVNALVTELLALCRSVPDDTMPDALESLIRAWRAARPFSQQLMEAVPRVLGTEGETRRQRDKETRENTLANEDSASSVPTSDTLLQESSYWAEKIHQQIEAWNTLIDRYFAWVDALTEAPTDLLITLGQDAHAWRREAVAEVPSLRTLGSDHIASLAALMTAFNRLDRDKLGEAEHAWLERLEAAHSRAQWFAGEKLAQAQETLDKTQTFADAMNMRFLYDAERRAFSIGYNMEDRRLDNYFYDLLASEARLGSFIAVARGEVPVEHWFALGRPFASSFGQRALLSWSGTMFEYLMPLLLTRHYENSLLDQGCRAAIACQIAYGKRRGLPWGISEAAYSALDTRQTYQYRAFGVPGLGLKRGLENDLVVAPYATALALPLKPAASAQNLRTLARRGMRGDYGFYESIDYTRQSDEGGDPGVIVKTYMAHHQGMSLLAIDNLLHDNIMQARFHSDPRVRATESLLYERVPANPPIAKDYAAHVARTRIASTPQTTAPVRIPTPDTPAPRTLLLGNAEYSVMITNAGGGVSKWKDLEISRWRADTTRDNTGSFIYIKNLEDGSFWSATAQPVGGTPRNYMALFSPEKAEFSRRDGPIETRTEIVVSPEDNVEVRRITFINHSNVEHRLELTSYVEIALATHAADRAHPAFSKLFVQTESLPRHDALLASRRPRASGDPIPWAVHVVSVPDNADGETRKQGNRETPDALFETDRAKFIGRGGSPAHPAAMDGELSGSVGAVLDPIFSLRRRILVPPDGRVEVKFVTGAGDSRETVVALAEKYCQLQAANRAVELAWTYAQLDLRHLRIQPDEALRYQQLAAYVLFPSASLRANEDRLKRNTLAQPALWAHGISGDLPIVALTIGDADDVDVARQLIVAHNYWRTRGLKCDLVILNEESASYEQPLQDLLRRFIQANAQVTGMDQPGGVFLRPCRDIPEPDLTLILTVARVVLVAARGSLTQQLGNMAPPRVLPPVRGQSSGAKTFPPPPSVPGFGEEPSPALPFLKLPYFNGTGGFTEDGREYVVYFGPDTQTPAPWINVLANPLFGTLVSESGMGFSWYGNSQSNRLTPWSNDPVLDPFGETIYIRDEDLGVVWTPTPRPIREMDPYRVRHGQGYSRWEHNSHAIEQELLTFVPVDDAGGAPVRVQRLRLRNVSSHLRRLTVTSFAEWTLGVEREDTQMHVVTEWDKNSQTMLARNAYHPDFGGRVAFTASHPSAASYTGDRTEFLGRNGSPKTPAALKRVKLSNRTGAGYDPCGALQVTVELAPGEQKEVLFLLGQGADANEARAISGRFRDAGRVEQALQTTLQWWDKTLGVVQVDTPELSVNFLLNRWLLYQDLSCRIWGRSAFYQSGGAFGFRDQLQDIMAVLYAHPAFAREQILRSASRQFVEGDVQHWWHPPSGAGVRTRISDDLLWLPYVTAQYVRVTGDATILDEMVPFLDGKPLEPDEHEVFNMPTVSKEQATLLDHCRRTIEKGHTSGSHGLPLIGAGDWNDGLNRVGAEGKGESVWLAWFLVHVLNDFAYLLRIREEGQDTREDGRQKTEAVASPASSNGKVAGNGTDNHIQYPISKIQNSQDYEAQARQLADTIEAQAWDGQWYRRAYFDDGTPLGSAQSDEAKIDSLPQSWSVISGMGDAERSTQALQSVEQHLVKQFDQAQEGSEAGMVLLFTPAFDKTPHDPGYIKGYVPGVRENGGQYTHGSLWMPLAYAMRGEGEKACRLLRLMNPVEHTREPEGVAHYKVEPYVVVADIYSLMGQEGRGGWTWYTGSAGWMYRVWIESALGFQKRGDTLTLNPAIPPIWNGFTLRYRHGTATYIISIENPQHVEQGVGLVELDGARLQDQIIPLQDDGREHAVRVVLGTAALEPEPTTPTMLDTSSASESPADAANNGSYPPPDGAALEASTGDAAGGKTVIGRKKGGKAKVYPTPPPTEPAE
jgi:cyclic beta-1,2-glucan synthetase